MDYEFDKYAISIDNVGWQHIGDAIKDNIASYGVAVIPKILNEDECESMKSGMLDFFEKITSNWDIPINRNDSSTFKQIYNLFPKHSMLIQNFGVGHSQVAWDIRQNLKIVNVFSKFWNVKPTELLTSFDGFSYHFPPEIMKRGYYRGNTWFHTDKSFMRPEFECLQSWVTANDVEEGDATLAFYESSNVYHQEFADEFGGDDVKTTLGSGDWYKLSKEQEKFYTDKGCVQKCIKCPKGSLVCWDSRTIHCGVESKRNRENSKSRAVIYTCYTPRSLATQAAIRKKQKAFNELRTTSHWPHKPKLFPVKPRTYGKELVPVTPIQSPKVSKLGLKLAGF